MSILFVASEASELKPFSLYLTNLRKLNWPIDYAFEGILEGRRVILSANGAGPTLAARAVEVAIRAFDAADLPSSRLEAVVSTGYCGAINPDLRENQIVVGTKILDVQTGESFECISVDAGGSSVSGIIVSQNRIANSSSEKLQLQSHGAIAVDMEASGVASRTIRAQLPFSCIKVVTDRADESFGFDLNEMRTTEGRLARGKIGVHALTHPRLLPQLFRLKRRSENAAKALGEFLVGSRIQIESGSNVAE